MTNKKDTTPSYIKTNIYTKAIAISPEDLEWIKKVKVKKSAAGKLNEIINFYKEQYDL